MQAIRKTDKAQIRKLAPDNFGGHCHLGLDLHVAERAGMDATCDEVGIKTVVGGAHDIRRQAITNGKQMALSQGPAGKTICPDERVVIYRGFWFAGENDLAAGRIDHFLEQRTERLARPTPLRPQVDNDWNLVRLLENFGLEGFLGDINCCHTVNAIASCLATLGNVMTDSDPTSESSSDTTPNTIEGPVPGIDIAPVSAWLEQHVDGAIGPFTYDPITGGHSNLTMTVTGSDGTRFVLRRPPLGHVLASAHDMSREHRIISGLQSSNVPVPPVAGLCTDESINGVPFYVMEFVDGHVLRDAAASATALNEVARANASCSLVDTMAKIHSVDLDAAGLSELGRQEGYIARQLKRWYSQWNQGKTRNLASVDRVHDRLRERIPEQGPASIVHGDYRLDNCMVDDQGNVIAVLDWEICTLGDPLADLGLLQVYWTGPDDDDSAWTGSATTPTGFWNRDELATRYAEVSGQDISELDFYVAFAYWKLACILEGVYSRYLGGALGEQDPASLEAFRLQVDGAAASAEQRLEEFG